MSTQVRSKSPVSMKAEKFSTFPWPYWWSASAGLSETRTENSVTAAAIKSRPEWAASERIPKLPVAIPTMTFRTVIASAASSEFVATVRFSARIASELNSELNMTGDPSMSALSLWRALPPSAELRANQLCSVLRFFLSRSYFLFCGGILDPVSHRFGLPTHNWHCAGPNEVFYSSTHACTYSNAQATHQFASSGIHVRERDRGDLCRLTGYYG